ncbi:hypothetical protein, partial [uncultured Rikenella sp.]|uniref:hypothetical protein n=1 Tax=uncultured Rikenella sp. TaxID=368003 RepID=UPI0026032D4B
MDKAIALFSDKRAASGATRCGFCFGLPFDAVLAREQRTWAEAAVANRPRDVGARLADAFASWRAAVITFQLLARRRLKREIVKMHFVRFDKIS